MIAMGERVQIPVGMCQCGCGKRTALVTQTANKLGLKKGEPRRFINNHARHALAKAIDPPNPSGICMCGCGELTPIAKRSYVKSGIVKGQHLKYIANHGLKRTDLYHEEDRGYKTPCWIWNGHKTTDGYGTTHITGTREKAHRVFYRRYVGAIPDGLEIDHLCFVPSCVNPGHLEAVTAAENKRRMRHRKKEEQ